MEMRTIGGLALFYPATEKEAAGIIEEACLRSLAVIRDLWGLETPKDCRVYVMDSWKRFVFHSAPWPWRIFLAGTMPLWTPRVKKIWRYAGGWAQRYGRRRAIGVKPPRLIETAEKHIGRRIYIQGADSYEKVRQIACHELTHAFTAHLKLPAWLNEGLAMVTVDRMMGKPTIQSESIRALVSSSRPGIPKGYRRLRRENEDGLVYHYVRGYWITRYLMETRPETLRGLLVQRQVPPELERQLAAAFGMNREEFWTNIDRLAVSHFRSSF